METARFCNLKRRRFSVRMKMRMPFSCLARIFSPFPKKEFSLPKVKKRKMRATNHSQGRTKTSKSFY